MFKDKKELPEGKFVHEDPTLLSLAYTADLLPLMGYLSVKTLVNLTNTPFITSDSPVIKYNQWMESKNTIEDATGIAVKGLQIFMPIHPRMMICLYDNSVYKCGQKDKYIIKIESESDVHQLNVLQYLSGEPKTMIINSG